MRQIVAMLGVIGVLVIAVIIKSNSADSIQNQHSTDESRYKAMPSVKVLPEEWKKHPDNVSESIVLDGDICEGAWIVVVWSHDCPDCEIAVARYHREIETLPNAEKATLRFAFVEKPPFGNKRRESDGEFVLYGHLRDNGSWFVTTPLVLYLDSCEIVKYWEGHAPSLIEILRYKNSEAKKMRRKGVGSL